MLQVGIDSTLLRLQCNVTITNFKATLIHEWNIPRFFSIWTSTCRRMLGFWYSVNKVLFISTVFCEIRLLPMNLKNGCFRFLFPLILGNSYNIKCVKTMPWFWQIICICGIIFSINVFLPKHHKTTLHILIVFKWELLLTLKDVTKL